MEFRILGPLEVRAATGAVRLGGTKQRGVLAMLLLNAGRVVSSDRLIEGLWGESPPETAAKGLHNQVSALRKLLASGNPGAGGAELLTRPPGYLLTLGGADLDLHRFEAMRAEARAALDAGDARTARHKLAAALALWRGPALADCLSEPFAAAEADRLDELRLSALEERIDADLALARHADVVGELEGLIAEHPLRERLRAQLMLALYRSGRQAEALEAYRETRRTLVDELGIEPNRELQELERAMLAQAPSLDPPRAPPAAPPTAPPRPSEPAPGAPGAGSFVGRRHELDQLSEGLEGALGGRTALFLLAGEPGIGKSRLADEVAARAADRGALVVWGRCWEAGGAPAYWPWVQLLRAYMREVDAGILRRQLGSGAADLSQLLPELREAFPDVPELPAMDPEGARFRLFDSTTSFLRAAGEERPLVLVLDDMHAADPSSLLLLLFVARGLRQARVMLLVAYRDTEAGQDSPFAGSLAELWREPITRPVQLGGLSVPEVARFVEWIAGEPPGERLAAAIRRQTEGNPLFVGELVRLLVAEGRLKELESGAGVASVPRGLREVIGHRLRRLSPECKSLLSVASVLGREFTLDALGRLSGRSTEQMLERLDEALEARVVTELPARRGGMRFSHALIRDSLYGDLATGERLRLHGTAAEALEEVYGGERDQHLAEIAHHFFEAAPAAGVDRAVEYARRAGERAASLLAYEEAARLYAMALEALALRPGPDETARADLLLALGDAQGRAGHLAPSKETFLLAAATAERLASPERLARAALGYGGRFVWFRAGQDDRLIPLLERALAAQPEGGSVMRVLLMTRLAGALRDHPVPDRRRELTDAALAMARRIGDGPALARALEGTIAAVLWPRDTDAWLASVEELIRLAESTSDLEQAFIGHTHAVSVYVMKGDVARARRELAAASLLADQLRQPAQQWAVAVPQGMLALLAGEIDEAERIVQRHVEIGRDAQGTDMTFFFASTLQKWALRRDQGRLAGIEDAVEAFVDAYPGVALFRCVLASVRLELGDVGGAAAELERVAGDGFAALHLGTEWFMSACLLAEVCATLGDEARAERLYERLEPFGAYSVVSHPEVSLGPASRYLGLLAWTLGRPEQAAAHFELALEMNERMGARPWTARTQADYARMLLARDGSGDRERGKRMARAAAATFRELGMDSWADRSDAPARRVRQPAPS